MEVTRPARDRGPAPARAWTPKGVHPPRPVARPGERFPPRGSAARGGAVDRPGIL